MEQDYKPRRASKSGSSFLLGLFVGFLLGLCAAAAIAVYFFKTPVPFVDRMRALDKSPPAVQNLTETPAAGKAEETRPRFDFYRILPGQEEPVTERQLREAAKQAGKSGAPKATYFLQAGAFPNPADADNLKARLALLGLEAGVEPANLAEKGVWYRVRLGPYTNVDEINRIRQQLTQNGVDVSLVRIKDNAAKN
jgi:cell division protein FtsN